jgi:hypothetical protein
MSKRPALSPATHEGLDRSGHLKPAAMAHSVNVATAEGLQHRDPGDGDQK